MTIKPGDLRPMALESCVAKIDAALLNCFGIYQGWHYLNVNVPGPLRACVRREYKGAGWRSVHFGPNETILIEGE